MNGLKLNLQLFAENDKTFTQEELDRIIADRLAREKKIYEKQIEDITLEHKKELANFSGDNKEKELLEIENAKAKKENEDLIKEIKELKKNSRRADIITTYTKEDLPCPDEFSNLVGVIADIEDDEKRAALFSSFKKYANAIQQKVKQDALKAGTNPDGGNDGSNDNGDNPFKSGNITEITRLIRGDRDKAKELAQSSGNYEKYRFLF